MANEVELPRYTLYRSAMPFRPSRRVFEEGIQDAGIVETGSAGILDRHAGSSRPLLERADGIHTATVEVAAAIRGLPLSEQVDVRLAVQTALKLLQWAGRASHATASRAGNRSSMEQPK
jgi:hypothetical protein